MSLYFKSLYLKNFRIYEEKFLEFSPQLNLIYGKNAIGKTTILEAIYFLITGKSFRTDKMQDLIKEGTSYFYLEAEFLKHGIHQSLKISFNGKERKIFYNSTLLQTTYNLLGILKGVLSTPNDVDLVKGSPILRRHFLDVQISQIDPLYVHYLTRYHLAMRQRNSLLRQKSHIAIESFEYEMANAAAYITLQRLKLIEELNILSQPLHEALTVSQEILHIQYKTAAENLEKLDEIKQFYLGLFKKNRFREMEFGMTINGPHKDDLHVFFNKKEAKTFASEGQIRSFISSLRLSEWMRLKKAADGEPLMLIDDLGISLDNQRKEKLIHQLNQLHQVFVTLTNPSEVFQPNPLISLIEIR